MPIFSDTDTGSSGDNGAGSADGGSDGSDGAGESGGDESFRRRRRRQADTDSGDEDPPSDPPTTLETVNDADTPQGGVTVWNSNATLKSLSGWLGFVVLTPRFDVPPPSKFKLPLLVYLPALSVRDGRDLIGILSSHFSLLLWALPASASGRPPTAIDATYARQ